MVIPDTLGATGRLPTLWAALRGLSGRPAPPGVRPADFEQLPRVDAVLEIIFGRLRKMLGFRKYHVFS